MTGLGRVRPWWDACLSGTEGIGLAWAAMLGGGDASAAGSRCNGTASGLAGIAACSYCPAVGYAPCEARAELERLGDRRQRYHGCTRGRARNGARVYFIFDRYRFCPV